MIIQGRILLLGDNINTDLLHPPSYFSTQRHIAVKGAFAGLAGEKIEIDKWKKDDKIIIVAGKNFGCGSSRESTIRALKDRGVVAIVAESYSHIFRRTALAQGLRPYFLRSNVDSTKPPQGAAGKIDTERNLLSWPSTSVELEPLDPLENQLIKAGGLVQYLLDRNWNW